MPRVTAATGTSTGTRDRPRSIAAAIQPLSAAAPPLLCAAAFLQLWSCSPPDQTHHGAAVPREHLAELAGNFGFTKGVRPVAFNLKSDAPTDGANAAACGRCHEVAYRNWKESRHRVALTNPLYRESHAREPSAWCVNCHAPLMAQGGNPHNKDDRILAEEGVSCSVCHVRGGKILTGGLPAPGGKDGKHEHAYQLSPVMRTSSFCAECHQFNFPQADHQGLQGQAIRYASLVMQDTHNEWRSSAFAQMGACQTCHLGAGTPDSHRFAGGHNLERLAEALQVRGRKLDEGLTEITVITLGIGHAFPTGDLFRALRVRIKDRRGHLLSEIVLKRTFLPVGPKERAGHLPTKRLAADTTVPPPMGDHGSSRSFVIRIPREAPLTYELHIDYLNDVNHLLTGLPANLTSGLIKHGRLDL